MTTAIMANMTITTITIITMIVVRELFCVDDITVVVPDDTELVPSCAVVLSLLPDEKVFLDKAVVVE